MENKFTHIFLEPYSGQYILKRRTFSETSHGNLTEDVTILVNVYALVGVWRKKIQIGWISLGESSSTEDEQDHWHEMIQGLGTTVSKWHHLMIS
ncbi:unnamed protein product [Anisakis simplex]|uniref:Ovule protein n=1 Tax=Anisakis simplex TaxID=6269 RepID=A0A0M3JF55_ANISI|nr:unnamed protein product [Anisakis simplex]